MVDDGKSISPDVEEPNTEDYIVKLKPKKSFKAILVIGDENEKPDRGTILGVQHWEYIGNLLKVHGEDEKIIEKVRFHYIQAAKHFYKHGRVDKE